MIQRAADTFSPAWLSCKSKAEACRNVPALLPFNKTVVACARPTGDDQVPFVLVVEDEAMIREFITEDLQEAGYQVLMAGNADAAVDILEGRHDIGLVFTDVNMPGSMDGLALAACVRGRWPQVHIVITSGRSCSADKLGGGAVFVPKPYHGSNIIDAIGTFPDMRARRVAP